MEVLPFSENDVLVMVVSSEELVVLVDNSFSCRKDELDVVMVADDEVTVGLFPTCSVVVDREIVVALVVIVVPGRLEDFLPLLLLSLLLLLESIFSALPKRASPLQ